MKLVAASGHSFRIFENE